MFSPTAPPFAARFCPVFLMLTALASASIAATPWRAEVLLAADLEMGSVSVGDLDTDAAGNEIVVATQTGRAIMVRRQQDKWQAETIAQSSGEILMGAIGDVDPNHPGNEYVGVGMAQGTESDEGAGQATLVWREGKGWASRVIFTDDHMLHGVTVGDIASTAGNEVVVAGFSHRVQLLSYRETEFDHQTIYVANDKLKIVLAADVLPDRSGNELLTTGTDGCPQVLWQGPLGWHHQTILADPWGQSRIVAGPAGVVIGGDGGKVTLATRSGDRWQTETIGRDKAKIRGVVLADLDPQIEGPEIYSCGYSGRVLQFSQTAEGYWVERVIYTGDQTLHHLVAAEFDSQHPGPELLTCGHGGKLVALYPGDE